MDTFSRRGSALNNATLRSDAAWACGVAASSSSESSERGISRMTPVRLSVATPGAALIACRKSSASTRSASSSGPSSPEARVSSASVGGTSREMSWIRARMPFPVAVSFRRAGKPFSPGAYRSSSAALGGRRHPHRRSSSRPAMLCRCGRSAAKYRHCRSSIFTSPGSALARFCMTLGPKRVEEMETSLTWLATGKGGRWPYLLSLNSM
mmetsp:Transcript_14029/g.35348  ORF Transcript_14029/g.35348 Transcript_14029/m.35348 type:complete len:209 (-) Transcript_14029:626-1252(-)